MNGCRKFNTVCQVLLTDELDKKVYEIYNISKQEIDCIEKYFNKGSDNQNK